MTLPPHERVFVPLDTPDLGRAKAVASDVAGHVGGVKVGKELFTALGPGAVLEITGGNIPLFLDLKFHDIPNTVAGAVGSAVNMKPYMLNVHAAGGRAMMRAAADAAGEAAAKTGLQKPLVLGVTVLTSLDDSDLRDTGIPDPALDQVKRLAALTQESGLDGVKSKPCARNAVRISNSWCPGSGLAGRPRTTRNGFSHPRMPSAAVRITW